MTDGGDWLLLEELLERGESEFVDRLRAVTDADALGRFAERWYADPSPNARRLLLAYLERPLNAYRHEALVKRLFKRAEAAGDDAVMARFLVELDRSVRRVRRTIRRRNPWSGTPEPFLTTPVGTAMPRGRAIDHRNPRIGPVRMLDWVARLRLDPQKYPDDSDPSGVERRKLERFRLFSVPTRQYLRRRAWRYFRQLGLAHPERYIPAMTEALTLYQDADVDNGLALIDNWGLIHALFHHSPVLLARRRGWAVADGRSLAELEPAPIYEGLWRSAPKALCDLMTRAGCRPVRRWAARMLSRHMDDARAILGIEEVLGLLSDEDPEVVAFAVDWLRGSDGLSAVPAARWLAIAETASPAAIEVLAEIMSRQISSEQITREVAARMAAVRPLPLARLGLGWLKARGPTSDDERPGLLALLEAGCEPLRPEILGWLRSELASTAKFRTDWLLEFLDCRHADARAEGMAWFRAEARARDDVALWRPLLESPYDDVRLALSAELQGRLNTARGDAADPALVLDPERLRLLWASVLLNVHRGSRAKPGVVEQVAHRLGRRPEEAEALLPLLAVGLRSLRAPERRAALVAVVRLVERRPGSAAMVGAAFPELQWA